MGRTTRQFLVYTKVTILCLIVAVVAVFVVKNCGYTTRFWPGAVGEPVSTLWLMLMTGVMSVVIFWILSRMRRIFKDLAELRAEQAAERRRTELLAQEKRIDEKLRKAAEGDEKPDA